MEAYIIRRVCTYSDLVNATAKAYSLSSTSHIMQRRSRQAFFLSCYIFVKSVSSLFIIMVAFIV